MPRNLRLKGVAIFLAGAMGWEITQLWFADTYARVDIVNAIGDAEFRSRHGDFFGSPEVVDPDSPGIQLLNEFRRCGGKSDQEGMFTPEFVLSELDWSYFEARRRTFRYGVAEKNGAFKLKALQLCRATGRCRGDWADYVETPAMPLWGKASTSPLSTPEQRLQIAKDFACGFASRLSHADTKNRK